MFRKACLLLALVAVAAPSAGCRAILNYPVDRAKDLIDVIGFEMYWGQGVVAHAQATKLVQLGAGSFDGDIFKYHRRAIGSVEEMRAEAGLPLYYFTVYDRVPRWGNSNFLERNEELYGLGEVQYSLKDPNDRGFYEVGITAVAFAGLGVSLDVFQTIDFMVGWLGIDIGRDDARNDHRPNVVNPRYQGTGETPISASRKVRRVLREDGTEYLNFGEE